MKNFKITLSGYAKFVGVFFALFFGIFAYAAVFSPNNVHPKPGDPHFGEPFPTFPADPEPAEAPTQDTQASIYSNEFEDPFTEFKWSTLFDFCKDRSCKQDIARCTHWEDDCEIALNGRKNVLNNKKGV